MKYGLKETQESPPDGDKLASTESSVPEAKAESSIVGIKTTENESESADINTALNSEGHSCKESSEVTESKSDKLPVSEPVSKEPSTINQISITEQPETGQISDATTSTPLETEISKSCGQQSNVDQSQVSILIPTEVQQTTLDDQHQVHIETAMVYDTAITEESIMEVVTNDEETNHNMEVVASIDDENSEVEMVSHSPTPNDVDMTAIVDAQQDNFVRPNVNYKLKNAPIVELSRCSWGRNTQKYLRGCVFSPDGTCILTTVNKDGIHIFELPLSLYENESVSADRPVDILTTAVHVTDST